MPHSQPENLPIILAEIAQRPRNILDLGCGHGNYGAAIRAKFPDTNDPHDHVYLTGIDIFEEYRHEQWKLYDSVIIEDIVKQLYWYDSYELVLFCDVIEHFPKEQGLEILKELIKGNTKVIVSTPEGDYPQKAVHGNPNSAHLSTWTAAELEALGGRIIHKGVCAIAVFEKV